jgi:hypothetical protein
VLLFCDVKNLFDLAHVLKHPEQGGD